MSRLIDTHIHLDSRDFNDDLESVLGRAFEAGVKNFVIPGASLTTLDKAMDIASLNPMVFTAAGVHPCHVDEILDLDQLRFVARDLIKDLGLSLDFASQDSFLALVKAVLASPYLEGLLSPKAPFWKAAPRSKLVLALDRSVAVGECGLDFFRLDMESSLEVVLAQLLCFCLQIEEARRLDLPLILHVRDSKDSLAASLCVIEILRFYLSSHRLRGVFHCFNAMCGLLEFKESFYYGIGGILTFKGEKKLTSLQPKIPLDRILLETDAPYLAPTPHRGKRNESAFLPLVAKRIASLLDIEEALVFETTTSNARNLFGF